MIRYSTIAILFLVSLTLLAVQSVSGKWYMQKEIARYSSGSPAGKTGAPGEGAFSCTECHPGPINDGTSQNLLTVYDEGVEITSYMPGEVYTVSLVLVDENVKEGFQATVLDNNYDNMAGTFLTSGSVGTQIVSWLGRDYATHISASTNAGNVSWDWEWQAPATESGPVTFYVASNIANGNGTSTGDAIYLSQHVLNSVLSVDEATKEVVAFKSGYHGASNTLHMQFNALSSENMFVKLVDLSGKSVFSTRLGNSTIGHNKQVVRLPQAVPSGMYAVQFFLGNKPMTAKIVVD